MIHGSPRTPLIKTCWRIPFDVFLDDKMCTLIATSPDHAYVAVGIKEIELVPRLVIRDAINFEDDIEADVSCGVWKQLINGLALAEKVFFGLLGSNLRCTNELIKNHCRSWLSS